MLTPAAFKLLFPEFVATGDERIQLFIDKSDPYFDAARWGDFYADGQAYWVAHTLFLADNSGTPGAGMGLQDSTTSKKVGEVQVSKSAELVKAGMNDPYMRTGYGQKFSELRRMIGIGAVAA